MNPAGTDLAYADLQLQSASFKAGKLYFRNKFNCQSFAILELDSTSAERICRMTKR
jgi:hypothetical protein